jgi:hypothetical protein
MATLAEETTLDLQAKARRVQRERIEGNITAVEQRISSLDKEIGEKSHLLDALAKIEALVIKLPPQAAARRSVISGAGLGTATVPCVRTELVSVIAGAVTTQGNRLVNLEERRRNEEQLLAQLRSGVKEFAEAGA